MAQQVQEPPPDARSQERQEEHLKTERAPRQRSWIRRHPLATIVLLILAAGLAVGGSYLWTYLSSYESTDDAQVDGYIYPVSARINGRVTAVNVDVNQQVKQGQVLVQLDPTDYQVAVQRAQADLAQSDAAARAAATQIPMTTTTTSSQTSSAHAAVEEAQAGISMAEQQYEAAQARVREAQANHIKAQQDVERYRPLVGKQEISQQQFDQAVATADAMRATVDTAKANADAVSRQVTQAKAHLSQVQAQEAGTRSGPDEVAQMRARASSSQAGADMARATLEQQKLNLKYTTIDAQVDGVIGQRNVQVGQQVQPGQQLLSIVPLNDLWVTANYKETQLRNMRVGQRAQVHVDATDQTLEGQVDSFPGATGARYSLLPPENATGNYVKVVQRLPVKIVVKPNQNTQMLRPGMSIEAKVWVR
jgi:membrane fusion protein, multidrug efflux system